MKHNKKRKLKPIVIVIILLFILGIGTVVTVNNVFNSNDKLNEGNKITESNSENNNNQEENPSSDEESSVENTEENNNGDNSTNQNNGSNNNQDNDSGNNKPNNNPSNNKEEVPSNTKILSLYKGQPNINERFYVKNMMPGDIETKYYKLKVNHSKDLDVFFGTKIKHQTNSLDEILSIKVILLNTNEIIYDGTMKELQNNDKLIKLKHVPNNESNIDMKIEVSLPKEAGNEYQNTVLTADFLWYVIDEDALIPPTKYDKNNIIGITLVVLLGVFIFFIYSKVKEEENERN